LKGWQNNNKELIGNNIYMIQSSQWRQAKLNLFMENENKLHIVFL